MRTKLLSVLVIIAAILSGCKLKDTSTIDNGTSPISGSGGDVTFKGQVYDRGTGAPIVQAVARVVVNGVDKGDVTDSSGIFNFTTNIDQSGEYPFITSKEGYYPDTLSTFALIGKTIQIPAIYLSKVSTTVDPSGNAASIVLKSQSVNNIGIKGSGSQEAANLVFEVQDANGKPVDPAHAVTLFFSIGSSPGSGEYIFPASVKTNSYGQATVTVNSGTKAGVVQVIATTTVNGTQLRSIPVAMAVYGGLPDPAHFIVACDKLNYPYLGIVGQEIQFSAYVGDKYSNPVRPGTTVYFETTSGIIAGSAQTNQAGVATVSLLTEPSPNDPTFGPGFFVVTAKTVDETSTTISTTTKRLLSGPVGTLSITPTTFAIDNGGSQDFTFTLEDILGHPMDSGTSVSISTDGGACKLYGATGFTMPDVMTSGNGSTIFSFSAEDGNPTEDKLSPLTITISVTSPRGNTSYSIRGTIR